MMDGEKYSKFINYFVNVVRFYEDDDVCLERKRKMATKEDFKYALICLSALIIGFVSGIMWFRAMFFRSVFWFYFFSSLIFVSWVVSGLANDKLNEELCEDD